MELTPYQRDILIRTVLGEARGEGSDGMAAVANVILNRANSGRYPSDPAAVALQPSQFSVWNSGAGGGKTYFDPNSALYQRAANIVDQVAGGQIPDRTNGALFYHNTSVSPNWAGSENKYGTTRLGNHIFYNGKPTPPGEIPNTVASMLDTVPGKSAPVPRTMSNALKQERSVISSSAPLPLKSALARLASSAAREKNLPVPASVEDRVTARNKYIPKSGASGGAGDSLGLNPVYKLPGPDVLFDAGYDTTRQNIIPTQPAAHAGAGMVTTAPQPASVWDRITARNKNTRPIATLPPIGPTGSGMTQAQRLAALYSQGGPTRPGMNAPGYGGTAGFATGPMGAYPGGPMVPGAAGSINLFKDQSQLPAGQYPAAPGGMNVPAQALAPVPFSRPQGLMGAVNISKRALGTGPRAPVPFMRPQGVAAALAGSSRPPLEILVQGAGTLQPRPQSVVSALRQQGMSPAQAYAFANAKNRLNSVSDRHYDGPGNTGLSSMK